MSRLWYIWFPTAWNCGYFWRIALVSQEPFTGTHRELEVPRSFKCLGERFTNDKYGIANLKVPASDGDLFEATWHSIIHPQAAAVLSRTLPNTVPLPVWCSTPPCPAFPTYYFPLGHFVNKSLVHYELLFLGLTVGNLPKIVSHSVPFQDKWDYSGHTSIAFQ